MQRVSHLTAAVISVPEEEGGDCASGALLGLTSCGQGARYSAEATDARRAALEAEEPQLFRPQSADFGTEPLVGLCLPLLTRDRGLGVLEAYGTEALAESDAVELLGSLASQAASALENARLYGELADREHRLQDLVEKLFVAQEEERRHIAYEVHDGLAQVAVAAHTYLNAFARRYVGDDVQGREKLDRALELIEQTVREARHIIANLRPTALDDFGLATALRLQAEEFRSEDCETVYEEALGEGDGDDGDALVSRSRWKRRSSGSPKKR
jgi:signal transduction histidine kinase